MAEIRHDVCFLGIVDQLTGPKEELGGRGLFKTYKDLLRFAAMVGYKHKKKRSVESVGREVPQRIFESSNDNDLIYILALVDSKDPDLFKESDEAAIYKTFEEFANGGLEIIQEWLEDKPSDTSGLSTLLEKTYKELGGITEDTSKEIKFS